MNTNTCTSYFSVLLDRTTHCPRYHSFLFLHLFFLPFFIPYFSAGGSVFISFECPHFSFSGSPWRMKGRAYRSQTGCDDPLSAHTDMGIGMSCIFCVAFFSTLGKLVLEFPIKFSEVCRLWTFWFGGNALLAGGSFEASQICAKDISWPLLWSCSQSEIEIVMLKLALFSCFGP